MFLLSYIVILLSCALNSRSEPIELTNQTWKAMLKGQWMIEFYAPWCPACQNFKSTWNDFAKVMVPKNVQVAAINIEESPSLSPRFRITALPTIFYVRDGLFRQYSGERSLSALKTYLEKEEWQQTDPVSSYFSPDSILVSAMSAVFDGTLSLKNVYTVLQDEHGWPTWLIYLFFAVAVGIVGLTLGYGMITMIDYCIALITRIVGKTTKKENIDLVENESEPILTDNQDQISNSSDINDQTIRQRRLNE